MMIHDDTSEESGGPGSMPWDHANLVLTVGSASACCLGVPC